MKKTTVLVLILLQGVLAISQVKDTGMLNRHFSNKSRFFEMIGEKKTDERLDSYDVKQYVIDIEVDPTSTSIVGKARIRATVKKVPFDTLVVQLIDTLTVDSVYFNNRKSSFIHNDDEVKVLVNESVSAGEAFIATFFYGGLSKGGGVSTGTNDPYDKHVTWSLSESFHAKEWFPCKQVLSDKADSARINLTTEKGYVAVSNGRLVNKEQIGEDKVKYHWETHYPINYYLLSFAVSDYQEYSFYAGLNSTDSVLVQNFVYDHPDYLSDWKEKIDRTAELLKLYSGKFGIYPFFKEKYGHSLMERGGGMEHQTITTLNDFRFLLVAHELVHQWFGDYVTCGSWQDIWINEGFASYGEYIALENLETSTTPAQWMQQAHLYAAREPEGSVYIPFEDASDEYRIFNFSLSYKKGAALLHMIRYLIDDDDLFFQVLRSFLDEYKNGVATGEDFMNTLNSETNKDFTEFFQQWYYGKGFPEYEVAWQNQDDSVYIDIDQTTSSDEPDLFTIPVELRLEPETGQDTVILHEPKTNHDRIELYYPHEVENIILDPDNWILNAPSQATRIDTDDPQTLNFEIYPNPAKKLLKVRLEGVPPHLEKELYIKDLTGKTILTTLFYKNYLTVNTSRLSPGLYLIEIRYEGGQMVKRFIKQ